MAQRVRSLKFERPSHSELNKKIENAKIALEKNYCLFADKRKALGELTDLNLKTEDCWDLIRKCLDEIKPEHYAGTRPPLKSYEPRIEGKELFAFCWNSKCCGKMMYLKFVLKNEYFYYVSFHEDKK